MKKKASGLFQSGLRSPLRWIAVVLLMGTLLTAVACQNGSNKGNEPTNEGETQPMDIPKDLTFTATGAFVQEGTLLTTNYTHENPTFDFSDRLKVGLGVTWKLSSDAEGANVIENKTVTLKKGENRYYVTVNFRKDVQVYEVLVNYRSAYTVEFYTVSSALMETQTVEKGSTLKAPKDPTRDGYTFLGWYLDGEKFDFASAPTASCTLIAHWEKNDKSFVKSDTSVPTFEGLTAAMHVVWKDYANCNSLRPTEVICVLTQYCGASKNEYEIVLKEGSAAWKNPLRAPVGALLTQGEGGAWTLSLTNLPEKADGKHCSYTLTQKPLEGNYTTLQSGSTATNTIKGYIPSVDQSAQLTTRNARLYDAAGNLIVFKGVVTLNVGRDGADTSLSVTALEKLKALGCNGLRLTAQVVGTHSGQGYVYKNNGSSRTGDYNDNNAERWGEADKQKMMDHIDVIVQNATEVGLYIVIDWGILTSNPYQYVEEAKEFFGILAEKYADNPYVIFEICNEPKSTWGYANGRTESIKAYGEEVIQVIRAYGSKAVVILAPNQSATALSAYSGAATAGDDPIDDPLDDDTAYNVAYTFHCYPYNYLYTTYSWKLRDAHEAGLTVITTEFSPMDGTFDNPDTTAYDMEEAIKFIRQFQEYDIGFFYFRYESPISTNKDYYHENSMFLPNLNLTIRQWTVDDMTACGRWYYEILTGSALFVTADFNTTQKKAYIATFKDTHLSYGLGNNVFPGFAVEGSKDGNTYFYKVNDYDALSNASYKTYCKMLWDRINNAAANGTIKALDGSTYTYEKLPKTTADKMELTYQYNGNTVHFSLSYGTNASGNAYGIILTVY